MQRDESPFWAEKAHENGHIPVYEIRTAYPLSLGSLTVQRPQRRFWGVSGGLWSCILALGILVALGMRIYAKVRWGL